MSSCRATSSRRALRRYAPGGDSRSEAESSTESSGDEGTPARRSTLLQDDAGYYVSSAEAINTLLDVRAHIKAWPRIPPEELHASSMHHPTYPEYRWLLHTRRIPAQGSVRGPASGAASAASGSAASQHPVGGVATELGVDGVATEDAPRKASADTFGSAPELVLPELPPCAGVADPDKPVWRCLSCVRALCKKQGLSCHMLL